MDGSFRLNIYFPSAELFLFMLLEVNYARTNQTHYFLSRKTKIKLHITFRYRDHSYINTHWLCVGSNISKIQYPERRYLYSSPEFQFVLKSEGIRYFQHLQHLSQRRNALSMGHRELSLCSHCHCQRWVDEGSLQFLILTSLQDRYWVQEEMTWDLSIGQSGKVV